MVGGGALCTLEMASGSGPFWELDPRNFSGTGVATPVTSGAAEVSISPYPSTWHVHIFDNPMRGNLSDVRSNAEETRRRQSTDGRSPTRRSKKRISPHREPATEIGFRNKKFGACAVLEVPTEDHGGHVASCPHSLGARWREAPRRVSPTGRCSAAAMTGCSTRTQERKPMEVGCRDIGRAGRLTPAQTRHLVTPDWLATCPWVRRAEMSDAHEGPRQST